MPSNTSSSENSGACDAFMEALDGFISGLISLERLRLTTSTLLEGNFGAAQDMQAALDSTLREGYLDISSHRVLSTLIELIISEDEPTVSPRPTTEFLNRQPAPIAGITPESDDEIQDTGLYPGLVLRDRFTLIEQINGGSMGKIFKAIDRLKEESGSDNPWVAIKSITEALANPPNALVALRNEAANAQRLSHPNIIRVFDFDRDGEHIFMTMELLDGASLTDLLNQHRFGRFPGEQARSIIEGICQGLHYAHDLGIVHADVKPGNIFVTSDNNTKLLDFGVSLAASDSADEMDVYAHTPSYASCEVLEGAAPTAQDDVYSLACVAYWILAGRRAFDGATAHSAEADNLELKPVEDITDYEWAALQKAMAFRRVDRTVDVLSFLNEFSGENATGEPPDATGEPSDAAGEPSDAAGEPSDAAGEPADTTGEPSGTTGELSDTTGEPPDANVPEEAPQPHAPPVKIGRNNLLLMLVAAIAAIAVALWPEPPAQNLKTAEADAESPSAVTEMASPEDVGPPTKFQASAEAEREKPITPKQPVAAKTSKTSEPPVRRIAKPDPITLLARQAEASLDARSLITPAESSAKFYITEMLAIDPEADASVQARRRFTDLMMLEVMVAIADENFDAAEQLIADTKSVGVTEETIERYELALTNAREARIKRETDSLTAIFASATPAAILSNSAIEQLPVTELLPDPLWDAEVPDDISAQPEPSLDPANVSPGEIANIPGEPKTDQSQEILPLSAFEIKRHVQPKFPQRAADRNISGWVDLRFLVNTKGKTENIEIMDAEPKGSFEKAATRAVSKWRFEPVMVDGMPVEKFSIVRLRFDAQ